MTRLVVAALGAFALLQTAPAQDLGQDIADFRHRQYVTGRHTGCQLQLADAIASSELERAEKIADVCAGLERQLRD